MEISEIFWNGCPDMSQSLTKVVHTLNEFSLLKKNVLSLTLSCVVTATFMQPLTMNEGPSFPIYLSLLLPFAICFLDGGHSDWMRWLS